MAAVRKSKNRKAKTRRRRKFEDIYAPSHPLRAALQKLHTLDPIRAPQGLAYKVENGAFLRTAFAADELAALAGKIAACTATDRDKKRFRTLAAKV